MVFVKEVVVLSEGPWPLGNVGAELLERVCHPGGDDGQIRDRLGVGRAGAAQDAGAVGQPGQGERGRSGGSGRQSRRSGRWQTRYWLCSRRRRSALRPARS